MVNEALFDKLEVVTPGGVRESDSRVTFRTVGPSVSGLN